MAHVTKPRTLYLETPCIYLQLKNSCDKLLVHVKPCAISSKMGVFRNNYNSKGFINLLAYITKMVYRLPQILSQIWRKIRSKAWKGFACDMVPPLMSGLGMFILFTLSSVHGLGNQRVQDQDNKFTST